MLIPEVLNAASSSADIPSAELIQRSAFASSIASTPSISMTSDLPTRSIARDEYCLVSSAKTRERPKLIMNAAGRSVTPPTIFNIWRREIALLGSEFECIICCNSRANASFIATALERIPKKIRIPSLDDLLCRNLDYNFGFFFG